MWENWRKKLLDVSPNLWWKVCLGIGIVFSVVYLRISLLEYAWASDEIRWLFRSRQFILSLQGGSLSETISSPHPGVTTMWLGGMSLWLKFKGALSAPNLASSIFVSPETLAIGRFGIAVITIGTVLIAWYLLHKLLGWWRSCLAIIFISFDPFYLWLSRMLHTDALAASFTLLSVLSFFVYLEGSRRSTYVIFSGIAFGLASLSKITAFSLVLYLPLLLGFYKIYAEYRRSFSSFHLWASWLGTACLTFFALWPGLWTLFGGKFLLRFFVFIIFLLGITYWNYRHIRTPAGARISKPKQLISGLLTIAIICTGALMVAKSVMDGLNWAMTPHEVSYLFLGNAVNDPGTLFYPVILSLRGSLLALPLLILGFSWFICHRGHSEYFKLRRIFLSLIIFIVVYIVPLSFAAKKISRYALPIFLIIDILAAIGFSILLKEFTHLKIHHRIKEIVLGIKEHALSSAVGLLIFMLIMFLQVVPVLAVHPYYAAYYNPIWKIIDIPRLFSLGGSVGSDKAALYLSQKPDAERLTVRVSPIAAETFEYYFPGKVLKPYEQWLHPDYEVVHLHDVQLGRDGHAVKRQLEHVIRINGIDYVWIYRVLGHR